MNFKELMMAELTEILKEEQFKTYFSNPENKERFLNTLT